MLSQVLAASTCYIMSDRLTIISRSGGFLRWSIMGRYWQVYPPLPDFW